MILVENILNTANQIITTGSLTDLEIVQLSTIPNFLEKSVNSFDDLDSLPSDTANNKGRLVYVTDLNSYYFSDGSKWTDDYNTDYFLRRVLYAWGDGNGYKTIPSSADASSPVALTSQITTWKKISGGSSFTTGITTANVAYAWGQNSYGQLGVGDVSQRVTPTLIAGGITNWKEISASPDVDGDHALGLTSTGLLYSWGRNSHGQLGSNSIVSRSSPVTVVGGITNWNQVSAGDLYSLGLTSTGIAYAWGINNYGQLGTNNTVSRSSPVTVVGGITNWSQVSAGDYHSLGLTSSGIAYAWGSNANGQLGDNTTVSKSSPVTVVGGITNWSQVSAGTSFNLGITSTGIAYGWGLNFYGQLGDNTAQSKRSPVTVVGGITNWSKVIASGHFNYSDFGIGITSTGVVYTWGANDQGQLGNGTTISRSSPGTILGNIATWSDIGVANSSGFAITVIEKGI